MGELFNNINFPDSLIKNICSKNQKASLLLILKQTAMGINF